MALNYGRSAAMFAVPFVAGPLVGLIERQFADGPEGRALASFATLPLFLAALALALLPVGAAMGDGRLTIRLTLRLMGRASFGIYWALAGMQLLAMIPLMPVVFLWRGMGPGAAIINVALMMTMSMMCALSVLAAVYQLWRDREPEAALASA